MKAIFIFFLTFSPVAMTLFRCNESVLYTEEPGKVMESYEQTIPINSHTFLLPSNRAINISVTNNPKAPVDPIMELYREGEDLLGEPTIKIMENCTTPFFECYFLNQGPDQNFTYTIKPPGGETARNSFVSQIRYHDNQELLKIFYLGNYVTSKKTLYVHEMYGNQYSWRFYYQVEADTPFTLGFYNKSSMTDIVYDDPYYYNDSDDSMKRLYFGQTNAPLDVSLEVVVTFLNVTQIFNPGRFRFQNIFMNGRCQCIEGFEYLSEDNLCVRNCSSVLFEKSIGNYSSEDPGVCLCQEGYYWGDSDGNGAADDCIINCINMTYSTGNFSNDSCLCLPSFEWNASELQCVINCSSQAWADFREDNMTDMCVCDDGYEFNETELNCVIVCNMSNTEGREEGKENECLCSETHEWNEEERTCQRNCSKERFPESNGSVDPFNSEACFCQEGFEWGDSDEDGINDDCIIICSNSSVPYSTGQSSNDSCLCLPSFEWNASELQCVINCSSRAWADFREDNVSDVCICDDGYEFNETELNCVFICNISNSLGREEGKDNECLCLETYEWNVEDKKCTKNCSKDIFPNSNGSINSSDLNTCFCEENFEWGDSDGDEIPDNCVRVCGEGNSGIALKPGTLNECTCAQSYFWNGSNCHINCANENVLYSTGESINDSCICISSFVWNESKLLCEIDCQSIEFTDGQKIDTIDECKCERSYKWNEQEMSCKQNSRRNRVSTIAVVIPVVAAIVTASTVGAVVSSSAASSAAAAGGGNAVSAANLAT